MGLGYAGNLIDFLTKFDIYSFLKIINMNLKDK